MRSETVKRKIKYHDNPKIDRMMHASLKGSNFPKKITKVAEAIEAETRELLRLTRERKRGAQK